MVLRDFFTDRSPSRQDLILVFLVCCFPVAIWSWIIFFYDLHSFLLRLRWSQVINILLYMQLIVLIESAMLFTIITLLAFLLPRLLFLSNYVSQATILILALTFWAVGVHLNGEQIALGNASADSNQQYIWTAISVVVFLALSILNRLWSRSNALTISFAERLSFVSGVFLFLPLISLPYILIRNLVLLIT
jgi:hypothetical protein